MARERYRLATEDSWLRQVEPAVPMRDLLCFSVGAEEYGVDITRIREIVKARAATEVPNAPAFVLGVIAVRGTVLPVLDLQRRLRMPLVPMSRSARILIVDRQGEPFGLLVDGVSQVVSLAENEIEPAPSTAGGESGFIAGIGRSRSGRMVILLQLDAVLSFEVERLSRRERGATSEERR